LRISVIPFSTLFVYSLPGYEANNSYSNGLYQRGEPQQAIVRTTKTEKIFVPFVSLWFSPFLPSLGNCPWSICLFMITFRESMGQGSNEAGKSYWYCCRNRQKPGIDRL